MEFCVFKTFKVTERTHLEFRMAFNMPITLAS